MNLKFIKSGTSKIIKNRYLIVSLLFVVWILYFDENSITNHLKDRRHLHELEEQCDYYRQRIEADNQRYQELHDGKDKLEKFAREQYYMSLPNEDVYVVKEVEE